MDVTCSSWLNPHTPDLPRARRLIEEFKSRAELARHCKYPLDEASIQFFLVELTLLLGEGPTEKLYD